MHRRSKYLWRRLMAISLVLLTGAVLWSAVDRVVRAAGSPTVSPDCTVAAVRASQTEAALASAVPGVGGNGASSRSDLQLASPQGG
ncbi:MAG TPA: hypothetical protein VFN61_01745, partial [Acidimicrobiales bacterium]|nr:hypothetical protein [Acidimicrobiales bacterium]